MLNDGRWQLGTGNQTRMIVDTAGNVSVGGEIRSTGASGGVLAAHNPNNQNARVLLDWFRDGVRDTPRIRYGGSGEGSNNGFLIQGPGDEIKIQLLNFTDAPVKVSKGDRLAQGIVLPCPRVEWNEVEEMTVPTRGGFGSTGS